LKEKVLIDFMLHHLIFSLTA